MTKLCVIDDSEESLLVATKILEKDGHTVSTYSDPIKFLQNINSENPDLVVLDIMMPGMDGIEVLRQMRSSEQTKHIKVIVFSSKTFEYDRKLAIDSGADGFMVKPIRNKEYFLTEANRLLFQVFNIKFYGVRGTLPVPGEKSLIYGGNTSCVKVSIPGKNAIIFDCGSGVKKLGDSMVSEKTEANIFITHAHWDHLNAFPFFTPLYIPGNKVRVYGPKSPGSSVSKMISDQMSDIYFPITVQEFGGHLDYIDLHEESFQLDGIRLSTMLLRHPGNCLGYRIDHGGKSMCYITDNELFPEKSSGYSLEYLDKLCNFIAETDVLITDTTYTEEEYPMRVGWGHSSNVEVAKLAHRANVKKLCLFHHDPNQNDQDIEKKWKDTCRVLESLNSEVECLCPKEDEELEVRSTLEKSNKTS